MKLFGFLKRKANDTFLISELDRLWVEDNFRWLIKAFGFPNPKSEQILLTANYFPKTFEAHQVLIENIIQDLSSLFQMQDVKISFEVINDIRDTHSLPYEIEGMPFETSLEMEEGHYKIHIANCLQKQPKRLICSLVYEFIKIKLTEDKQPYDDGDDTGMFIYLAGIYFGFGLILSQNLHDFGRVDDGLWENRWHSISEMPNEIMAFALATYSRLMKEKPSKWKDELPGDLKNQFEKAIRFLEENPIELFDSNELEAHELFNAAHEQYLNNEFEEAISKLQKTLLLTNDDVMRADVYNNLGYYHIRLKNYGQSISYLENAVQIPPDFGYAYDNLGYVLIQIGELEEGKKWLDKAMKSGNNHISYTYRNLAIYYQVKGDWNMAEDYFRKSFESISDSVELLEYHYADFLFQVGEKDKALGFLKKAVEKGEPEAIEKMNEIKNS